MHKEGKDFRQEALPLGILAQLLPLHATVGEIIIRPEKNNRVQNTGLLGPAADQPRIARNDAETVRFVNLQEFRCLSSLALIGAVFVNHRFQILKVAGLSTLFGVCANFSLTLRKAVPT